MPSITAHVLRHQKNALRKISSDLLLPLESATYHEHLHSSIKNQSLILGKLVHSHMIRISSRPEVFSVNRILCMYCKCGDLSSAHRLFVRMPRRDVVSWNTLIAGYCQIGFTSRALTLFNDAKLVNTGIDQFSYAGALSACAKTADLRNGKIIHGLIVVSGMAHWPFLSNSLMDMYSKCRKIDDLRFVFDHAKELDEVSWNLLLSAYVRIGWPEVAFDVLVWMHRAGVNLNAYALGSMLSASSDVHEPEKVQKMLHACVAKVGLDLDLYVGSAMLDVYSKNGGLEQAIMIFDCIPNPSVVVFNAMIAGFCRLRAEASSEVRIKALCLFSEMLNRGKFMRTSSNAN